MSRDGPMLSRRRLMQAATFIGIELGLRSFAVPTLTVTPNPAAPSSVPTVTGSGFANARTRLLLDGVGASNNIFRPRKDGGFSVGITVSSTPKIQTLVAQQLSGSTWTEKARTGVIVDTIVVPPPPTGSYPPDTTLRLVAVPPLARPGYLAEITDPTWGTKVRRITNVHMRRNQYALQGPWNSDGSKIALYYNSDWRLLDGVTYADLGPLAFGVDHFQWSNVNPAKMYGAQWNIGVRTNTGQVGTPWTTQRTFPGYGYVGFGQGGGNLSDNDHLMAIIAYTGTSMYSGNCRIIAYDPVADVVRGIIDCGTNYPGDAQVSPSGKHVLVQWSNETGTGDYGGARLYDLPAVAGQPLVKHTGTHYTIPGRLASATGHATMAKNAAGQDIYVPLTGNVHLCADNSTIPLFGGQSTNFNFGAGGHISATNIKRPGWVYLSSGVAQPTKVGHEQILAIKTDGSATVEVFAFAHSANAVTPASYDATPFAAANRDGTKVMWGSAWDEADQNPVYAFVAEAA